jgi:NAD(P)-dependent dehydrogenase (short-subunit alcohol dehydrogenase family)
MHWNYGLRKLIFLWRRKKEQAMKKVAIVTGASRGIGKAVAERLARDGFVVVVNYASSAAEAEQVVSTIKAQGGDAIAIKADVSDAAQVEQLFANTLEKLGTVDVVVQNSGIMPLSPIGKGDAETFDKVISVNLRGTFLVLAQAAKHIFDRGMHHCIFQQRANEGVSHLRSLYCFEGWCRGFGARARKRTARAQCDSECGCSGSDRNGSLFERQERRPGRPVHEDGAA